MPELPEVQALTESLDVSLRGDVVEGALLRSVAALKTYDPPLLALQGGQIAGCARLGKFIDLRVGPLHLVVHLARAGWIRLRQRATDARPSLRGPLLMVLRLHQGRALEVTEQGTERHLALYVVRSPRDVPGVARLGVDALDSSLAADALGALLRGDARPLKTVLADQTVIAGIGNAYSDEILHAARLSPFRKASSVVEDDAARLHTALHDVLEGALARAREADPDTLRGEKKLRMQVHGRAGQRCPVCGDTVREVSYTSRSFQYCPTCQTEGRVYADRRLSRLLR